MNNIKQKLIQKEGITLISLVITIVIMLILAAVSINLIIGDNGLIAKAKYSKNSYLESSAKEDLNLKTSEYITDCSNTNESPTLVGFKNYYTDNKEIEYIILCVEEASLIEVTDEQSATFAKVKLRAYNYEFIIDSDLKITNIDSSSETPSSSPATPQLQKAIEQGEDIKLKTFFPTANNPTAKYNDNVIESTKDLPVDEYGLNYDKTSNSITVSGNKDYSSVSDQTGNNHTLYLKNGAEIKQDSNRDYYINLDGIDDYCQLDTLSSSINWADGFTVEFTTEWNGFNNRYSRLLDFANGGPLDNIIICNNDTNQTLLYDLVNNTTEKHLITTSIIPNAKENFKVEFIKNGSIFTAKTYKNNTLVHTADYATSLRNVDRLYNFIGKSNWNSSPSYFQGKIYSLKMTQADGTPILWYDLNKDFKTVNNESNKTISIIGSNYKHTIEDLTGNNHKLSLFNGATVQKENNDYYLSFDGTDDYGQLDTLSSSINWANGFTVEYSAEWNGFNQYARLFDFGNGAPLNNIIISNYNRDKTLLYDLAYDNKETYLQAAPIISNTRENVKVDFINNGTGFTIKTYKDNSLVNEITLNTSLKNIDRLYNYIGKSNWNVTNGYYQGKIYNIKITQADGTPILWYDINKWIELSR